MLQVRRHAWRVLPLLLLVAVYWPGLTNWFYQDDFGWLNLRREVHSVRDLGPALFAPKAHGNMRPLGESAYFLVFSSLFGVNALPFRIWAFATQIASLVLLGSIVRRITGSGPAGFWAQILWISNTGLAAAMCWTSIYNQVLSGFFFLLTFHFLLLHIDTGERRYYLGQWLAFVLGLGALETNVVYPAIAAVYTLLFARKFLRRVLPMFLVSVLAVAVHFHFAPPPDVGVYAPHVDQRLFPTLWTYWTWAMGPSRLALVLLSCALLTFLLWRARARDWIGLFGVAWFVIALAPYLPLSEHRMDYYLTVPVIGLAILGGWALVRAWRSGTAARIAALLTVGVYFATSLPAAWSIAWWHHERGTRVEDLVLGVAEIHERQPGKTILLDGIDTDLFWSGIADVPFRVMEIPRVYLTPDAAGQIQAQPDLLVRYILPQGLALRALQDGQAVVYRMDGRVLRNITGRYRALAESLWKPERPRFINLGDPIFGEYLGSGWEECKDGYRSLSRTGAIHIGGPRSPAEFLRISIFPGGHARFTVRVDGAEAALKQIAQGDSMSTFSAALPARMLGRDNVEISISNTGTAPLRFGFLEIR